MKSEAVRRGGTLRAIFVGVVVMGIVLVAGLAVAPASQAAVEDSSAVTVTAQEQDPDWKNAPFPDLELTVSQTTGLVDQGITLTWKGGKRSGFPDSQNAGSNFLQIMQCWGDDPAGGPDRTTCQYGSTLTAGNTRDNFVPAGSAAPEDAAYTAPGAGSFGSDYVSIPFRSVTGTTVASVVDGKQNVAVDVNTNEFFTRLSTNELPWAGTGADGTGRVGFELQTGLRAPGLGCGAPTGDGADAEGRSCWLVVVPRGTADAGEQGNILSGLFWNNWKHKLAVKLDFRALGVRCPIGAAERQVAGSELASHAIASWQPSLCSVEDGSIYSLITTNESDALLDANVRDTASALALASRSLGDAEADRLRYAPIGLAGIAVGFAIDRSPLSTDVPDDVRNRARLPFERVKLTPRLIAKLLTYSYRDSLPAGADRSHIGYVDSANPGDNPRNVTRDPDFLAINDEEWKYQGLQSSALADLLIPQGRSDAAWAVWQYVIADDEARRFLEGEPDPWGMVVNPWFATTAEENLSGTALTLPRDNFPKADPIEVPAAGGAGAINLVTWRPYTGGLAQSAVLTLRGDGQTLGTWDPNSIPPRYAKNPRELPGGQRVVGLTDWASASRYQVLTAELRNPAGQFVAPTTESLEAAAAAMTRDPQQDQVVALDPRSAEAKAATSAYPLAMPVYAASRVDLPDADLRGSFAQFIRYAVGPGQEPGEGLGQLPSGYAPIPESWRDQALAAAAAIETGPVPTTSPAPVPPTAVSLPAGQGAAAGTVPPAATAAVVGQPAAEGDAVTVLSGPPSAPDADLGAFGAVVPLSAGAGVAATAVALVFSRRRVI
ncbi:hypothetical protein [Microbacterium sp. SLBN-146]|uniref:hypothetical protein n=1 Tax=Microbacterium sp. SLBN-146 TaxID=2768457 RepID=UPI00114EDD32|nr:hypothetical protein [Microbacterium sp. SLBN-146]TQJ31355.1 hypothetical protein FBY39_1822 [Microbacterium sp. SLBN-146]